MPLPRPRYAHVDVANPEGWGQCERCGFWRNRTDLNWQFEWGGMHLYNKEILVCKEVGRCLDKPDETLRTIIIPPDPPPIANARVPNYLAQEYIPIQFQFGADKIATGQIPPWGAGPVREIMTQTRVTFLSFQYFAEKGDF